MSHQEFYQTATTVPVVIHQERLDDDRNVRGSPKVWQHWTSYIVGALGPIILPFVHLGIIYQLWNKYNRVVDRHTCTCSCWDTAFKGIYESGISSYKHVYFNSTFNTFKIWVITVIAVVVLYECGKYVFSLVLHKQVRWTMLVLLLSIIYPHYYSWWSYFNYWNDEFYSQWYHQLYFTATEIFSTACVILLANKLRPLSIFPLLVILDVAVAHILVSGFDQLVSNVVRGEGNLHQVLRDVGFFLPDLMHIGVALFEMRRLGRLHHISFTHLIPNKLFISSLLFISLSWLLCLAF